jgi:hypothetical protein
MSGTPILGTLTVRGPGKVISIAEECQRPGSDPRHPHFLANIPYMNNWQVYTEVVLPIIAHSIFVIATPVELNWFIDMLNCDRDHFPGIRTYITKIYFSGFYWFGGIGHNIKRNPMLALFDDLPNIKELGLTFHTAGLTASVHSERERLQLENTHQFDKSKQLKVMRQDQVGNKYGLQDILHLPKLRVLRLDCIKSRMVSTYCRASDPLSVFNDVGNWLKQGYVNMTGQQLHVTMAPLDL